MDEAPKIKKCLNFKECGVKKHCYRYTHKSLDSEYSDNFEPFKDEFCKGFLTTSLLLTALVK